MPVFRYSLFYQGIQLFKVHGFEMAVNRDHQREADGHFGGSLIHSPNIYDFPVSLQIARILGGDAVWVHDGQSVHFDELWMDQRADMLRLPGIVACSANRQTLETLVELARDWSRQRYAD